MAIKVVARPAQLSWSDFRLVDALPDGSGDEAQTATEMPAMDGIRVVFSNGKYSLPDLTLVVGLDRSCISAGTTTNEGKFAEFVSTTGEDSYPKAPRLCQ